VGIANPSVLRSRINSRTADCLSVRCIVSI
jgi:hypothetical protein